MKIKIKGQTTPYVLLLLGLVLLTSGFIFFNFVLKEKSEKKSIKEVVQINVQKETKSRSFYLADLYSCIDELVKEGSEKAFKEILNQKKIGEIDGLPVVFDGKEKVNVEFKEIKGFIENYVKKNYYICRNRIYNYKENKGFYLITDLSIFELYESGWVAKVSYLIKNIKEDKSFEGEEDLRGRTSYLKDLIEIYNKIINYEFETRAMEGNLFTFIYNPTLYSFYYGYPTTNLIYPCKEMRFDLEETKKIIKRILSVLISRYRVDNTENSLDVEEVFKMPLLNEFKLNLKVWFELLENQTYIDFSVVSGSNSAIIGNELIIRPDDTATLSPSQNSLMCSYDLFYDIAAPVKVSIDYDNRKINFVMLLKINNNRVTNKSIEEMKTDNIKNELSLNLNTGLNKCQYDEEIIRLSPKIRTVFEGRPVDALIKIEGDPCVFETKNGEAKVPIPCIGCKVYAIKEDYISEGRPYSGERELTLSLYKIKDVAIWTIYTPDWLIENWGNESFRNLKFQGRTDPYELNEEDPNELIKLVAKKEVPKFKELFLTILLNNGVHLFYYEELNPKNMSYSTNGIEVVEKISYEYYIPENNSFKKFGEITFNEKHYFYDERSKKFYACEPKIYEFKGDLELGREVYLIKLSNDKVVVFPYYTKVFNVKEGQTRLTTKYLMLCLPRGVTIKGGLIYRYFDEERAWIKQGSFSFGSMFKQIQFNN